MQQGQNQNQEDRKSIGSTTSWENMIKDSNIFDNNILDYLEKEFIFQGEDMADHTIQNPELQIKDNVFNMKQLLNEEKQILGQFIQLAKSSDDIKQLLDIFEAFNYELDIRNKEKSKVLERILKQDNIQTKQIEYLQDNFKKIERDIKKLRELQETKTLRQTGRYKGHQPQYEQQKKVQISSPSQKQQRNSEGNQQNINKQSDFKKHKSSDIQFIENEQKKEEIIDLNSVYDWIVDIDLITNISKTGWIVTLSEKFMNECPQLFSQTLTTSGQTEEELVKHSIDFSIEKQQEQQQQKSQFNLNNKSQTGWNGATIAVTGLYDKGKTFVLNNLTESNLPSGKKMTTKGISFKHVNIDNGSDFILVDTAGSYSPVKIENEYSIIEKEATEMFILDLVYDISDYFICVVNDFTSLDQRYLDKLSRNLQNSPSKTFREIIVIHNLKEVESQEIFQHVWETQVTQIYNSGSLQQTRVAAQVWENGEKRLLEKEVVWFKTEFTRHICIVNDDCSLGQSLNPFVFSLLRYWLKAVFIPINRPFNVVDQIMNYSAIKLSSYFKSPLTLTLEDMEKTNEKRIVTKQKIATEQNMKIPQVAIDSSGILMQRPDSFMPSVDILATESTYKIYMDIPGMQQDDILIQRSNVITGVKGSKIRPYEEDQEKKLIKNERKYGDFVLSFKIPEVYERKWKNYSVENGVLCIEYSRDQDEGQELLNDKQIKV